MQIKRFFKYFGIGLAILVAIVLVAGQIAHYSVPVIDPPGKMYSVNGFGMHLYCTGPENDKEPTIIIITGAGTLSILYYPLQETLSETVRTCTYDRPGLGWSEPNGKPSYAKNMSDDLHHLLSTAQIDGPIILAGHSLGGIVSLIYSAEHDEQVAGIAFIDSSHYNQIEYFGEEYSDAIYNQTEEIKAGFWVLEVINRLGLLNLAEGFLDFNPTGVILDEDAKKATAYFGTWAPPFDAINSEGDNIKLSLEQGKKAHYSLGDLPIISVSASDELILVPQIDTGFSKEETKEIRKSFHKELADLSNSGKHVIVNGTNHMSIIQNQETAEHILSLFDNNLSRCPDEINLEFDTQRRIVSCGANPPQAKSSILELNGIQTCLNGYDQIFYMNSGENGTITYSYEVTENKRNLNEKFDLNKPSHFMCSIERGVWKACTPEDINVIYDTDKKYLLVNEPIIITANIQIDEDTPTQKFRLHLSPNICANPELLFNVLGYDED